MTKAIERLKESDLLKSKYQTQRPILYSNQHKLCCVWSQEQKLNLNADKNEVCPFSTWSNDSTWNRTIFLSTQKVRVNTTPTPYLFGVILDRSLTFNAHLRKLTASLTSSIRIIRATAHTSQGWYRSSLKMAFHGLLRSKLDYAAPAWQSWLSDTNLSCLDRLQNRSL